MVASSAHPRMTVILAEPTRGSPMRSVPAVALLIAVSALAGGWSWTSAAEPSAATPMPAAPAHAPPAPASSAAGNDNEAAARHAKRTACINQARAKKLVGPQKTAFIKGCIDTP
jgi:hypothetical protein